MAEKAQVPAASKEPKLPEVSHIQTFKLVGSLMILFVVQAPLALRNIFMLKRKGVRSGAEVLKWYFFAGANLPLTLYFARNARLELRENRRKEQEYIEAMQDDEDSMSAGIDYAMMAFD